MRPPEPAPLPSFTLRDPAPPTGARLAVTFGGEDGHCHRDHRPLIRARPHPPALPRWLRRPLGIALLCAALPCKPATAAESKPAPTPTASKSPGVMADLRQRFSALLPHFDDPPWQPALSAKRQFDSGVDVLRDKLGLRLQPPGPGPLYVDVVEALQQDAPATSFGDALTRRDLGKLSPGLEDLSKPDGNALHQVRFVPELVMNVNRVADVPGKLELGVTYRSWNCPDIGAFADVRPMPQMSLRWSYH